MKIIGLTGGIASGKSTVSKILINRGYEVIDADAIARELQVKGSPLLGELVKIFGPDILDGEGSLNRVKLGTIIFSDESARIKVDELFLPAVKKEFRRRIAQSEAQILFLDVPLLFEAGFDDLTDANLVVFTSVDTQVKRLKARNNITGEEAMMRIGSQMPTDEKIKRADFTINNDGKMYDLEENVEEFLNKLG